MIGPVPEIVHCPHCSARNSVIEDACRACGKPLAIYLGPPAPVPRRMGLGTAMFYIGVIAVCLGITREAPPLGILLLVLVVPSLARTQLASYRRRMDERAMSKSEWAATFSHSLVLVVMLGCCALVANLGAWCLILPTLVGIQTLWPQAPPELSVLVGAVSSLVVSGLVIYHVGRTCWMPKD
jgi:hypothetical protein